MDSRLTLPYEERLCRLEYRPPRDDPERQVRMLVDNHFNLLVSSATIGTGHAYYKSKYRPPYPDMDPEYLPRLVELCHQNDIMIISWAAFNIQDIAVSPDEYVPSKLYPQWEAKYIDDEGHKTAAETGATGMCMFSTPYREKHGDFIEEILGIGFDGIFFDGFHSYGMPGVVVGCVCDFCAEHFNKDTGTHLPERINWSDPGFLRFVNWRYDELIESGHYLEDRIKSARPDAVVAFNTHTFPNTHFDWRWAIPLRKMRFGASQHAGLGPTNGIQQHSLVAKVAHAQNPVHADIWQPIFATREAGMLPYQPLNSTTMRLNALREVMFFPYQPPNAMTMRLHAFSAVTHGVFPWYGGPTTHINIFKEINDETQKRQPTFAGEDVRYIGVIMSDLTKDFYGHGTTLANLHKYRDNIYGIDSMLSQHQLLNGIVFDDDLENGDLKAYKVLLLSNTAYLSQKAIDKLTAWVCRGGTLIATFETSLYDEWGSRRNDFGLSDLFGIRHLESVHEEDESKVSKGIQEHFVQVVDRSLHLNDPSLNGGQANATFFGPYVRFELTASDVEIIARTAPESINYQWEASGDEEVGPEKPAVVQRVHGKGKVIYFGTDIGLAYFQWPEKNTRLVFSNIILRAAVSPLEVAAPTTVIATARVQQQQERLVVHLLNLPNSSNRATNVDQRLTVDEVIPVHDIRITLNDYAVSRARAFVQDRELTLEHDSDGKLSTVLPYLHIHEAVIFDLKRRLD